MPVLSDEVIDQPHRFSQSSIKKVLDSTITFSGKLGSD